MRDCLIRKAIQEPVVLIGERFQKRTVYSETKLFGAFVAKSLKFSSPNLQSVLVGRLLHRRRSDDKREGLTLRVVGQQQTGSLDCRKSNTREPESRFLARKVVVKVTAHTAVHGACLSEIGLPVWLILRFQTLLFKLLKSSKTHFL